MSRINNRAAITVFICAFIFLVSYAQAQKASVSGEATIANKIEYKSGGLRDPFQEENAEIVEQLKQQKGEVKPLPPLKIQGIVWGGRFPQAIINDKVVKIGDTIEGVRIIGITKSGVDVSFANQQYNLSSPASLNPRNIKEKP